MKRTLLSLTAALVCVTNGALAGILVGPAGSGTVTFDTLPAVTNWSFKNLPGGAGGTASTPASLNDYVQGSTNAASTINTVLASAAFDSPAANANATWSSVGHYVQTRPTGNAATLLMATLVNKSGADSTTLFVSYDLTVKTNVVEEINGHLVYYSLTGDAGSWQPIGDLSNQPTDNTPATYPKTATVTLNANWAVNGTLYVLWADDNGSGSPDTVLDIDNAVFATHVIVPTAPSIVTQPATTTIGEGQIGILQVSADGTGPLTYQWFAGNPPTGTPIVGATSDTLRATNMAGSGRAWSVQSDSGDYYVTVTGPIAPPATSSTAHLTVNPDIIAPTIRYAACNPADLTVITVVLSEPVDTNNPPGAVFDNFSWKTQAGANPSEFPASVDYTSGSTTVVLHLNAPRDPYTSYKVNTEVDLYDRAVTPNKMPSGTAVLVNCLETELLPLVASWRYSDDDTDPGPTWADTGFSDTAWSSGLSPMDAKKDANGTSGVNCRNTTIFGLGTVGTCIRLTSPITLVNTATYYFRTHFNYPGNPTNVVLRVSGKVDDAAVVYVNGTELLRIGDLPAAPTVIARRTFGEVYNSRTVGDDPPDVALGAFPALNQGDNVLAVQLVQVNSTSSDATMGLRLSALTPNLLVLGRLTIDPDNGFGESNVRWTGPGVLQSSSSLSGPWSDVDGGTATSAYPITVVDGTVFYRLRLP